MTLIEIFTDHVVNRKSLKEYVEIRKGLDERGEFNNTSLLQAQENLQCLKEEDNETLERMYETLNEVIRRDLGHKVEYPIDFIKQILKIGEHGKSAKRVCQEYKRVIDHHFNDA